MPFVKPIIVSQNLCDLV